MPLILAAFAAVMLLVIEGVGLSTAPTALISAMGAGLALRLAMTTIQRLLDGIDPRIRGNRRAIKHDKGRGVRRATRMLRRFGGLLPRVDQERYLDEWEDHLRLAAENGRSVRRTAISIIVFGMVPLAWLGLLRGTRKRVLSR